MRTADQIKAKLNVLNEVRKRLVGDEVAILHVDLQIEMLEWVLNQPTEPYH